MLWALQGSLGGLGRLAQPCLPLPLTYQRCIPCVPTGMNMGVWAVKWGRVILDALALPCVASTSKVRAGDTEMCGPLLGACSIDVLKVASDVGGEALLAQRKASPPQLYCTLPVLN